jgi:NTP pyrophosphatase (non-canonical NTP hydrolase)
MTKEQIESINALKSEVYENNKAKGFWDNSRNVGEMLMLVTSELGEAMEAHRKGKTFPDISQIELWRQGGLTWETHKISCKAEFETWVKDSFQDEISDAVIRLFDICGGLGIDLGAHIYHKLEYNKTREVRHGKAY